MGRAKKEKRKEKGKGKSKKGKGKGQQVDPLDETRHQELKEQEESQGFDPSLQESRGRRHRHWRTERRKKDPEVQQKKEEYEKSGQWPETRPEPLKEGSQRWNRMKELEKEFIEERRNLQERKQRQLEEETKMNQRLMDKLEEVQEMQRRQQELWERGLKQSQRSSSEEAETPLILKEGPGASSKWKSPSAERLREKCLQEKKGEGEGRPSNSRQRRRLNQAHWMRRMKSLKALQRSQPQRTQSPRLLIPMTCEA